MSSEIVLLKDRPDLMSLVKRAVPNYRKTKAIIFHAGTYTAHGSYWDGGSREFAVIVRPGSIEPVNAPSSPPQFGGGDPVTVDVPDDGAIIVAGTFRGKVATVKIYLSKEA